ncbi:hypothetical protein L7F22_016940 [Adiantum nelumboides]|nr:hypothetical protein [Adiantum nelumboides]
MRTSPSTWPASHKLPGMHSRLLSDVDFFPCLHYQHRRARLRSCVAIAGPSYYQAASTGAGLSLPSHNNGMQVAWRQGSGKHLGCKQVEHLDQQQDSSPPSMALPSCVAWSLSLALYTDGSSDSQARKKSPARSARTAFPPPWLPISPHPSRVSSTQTARAAESQGQMTFSPQRLSVT